ncbi:MAG: hypothetical protein TQ37_09830 [Candidatus Synechococcus spongiarum 15L]|uniref:Zinc metalloprotease n=2 Tax=Candidatus Synechococcus spongiarum TaxID=431041 RepID=A0A1T1D6S7_9SYNE|nr:site-2 protease family protein [Candidatus Synechococcus spongiarum]KKZ10083.1 MAG: hypothetical protein TQ37_09830 [Candidatus Synechococcus spongiarum 15L]MCY4359310.1 site-2 protease family protein [Cyanobacteria bacterium MAG APA_bin_95]OOV36541.1 site-2 protease family protein [Candidatus Synechococcus spongiarum LMB bulk15N]
MGKAWTIGTICGIPLRVHPSWLLIVGLATVLFQAQYGQLLQDRQLAATTPGLWMLGFLTVLLLFGSVLLHELGHSLVALRHGIKVRNITLFLFGGVATVEKECRSALAALQVAAAGPAVSFALALGFFLLANLGETVQPVAALVCQRLMVLNLVLGIFNLMPGLPLDGGLIVKALVWHFSGSRRRGIQVAAAAGLALALTAIASGLWFVLVWRISSGLWLVLLGWFGLEAASTQLQLLRLQDQLLRFRVQQVQGRRYRILDASLDLRTVSRQLARETTGMGPQDWFLVYDGHRWLGRFQPEVLKTLPVQCWPRETVSQQLQPRGEIPDIRDSAPLWQAALALERAPESRLLVLNGAGLPSGTIDRVDLVRAVCKGLGIRLPEPFLGQVQRLGLYPPGLQLGLVASTMADSEDANSSVNS